MGTVPAKKNLSMQALQESSQLFAGSSSYLHDLYESFLKNPDSIPKDWRDYFEESILKAQSSLKSQEISQSEIEQEFRQLSRIPKPMAEEPNYLTTAVSEFAHKQAQVQALIQAYRLLGHLHADLDPLKGREMALVPELMLSFYKLTDADLDTLFEVDTLPGPKKQSLREILNSLKKIYCGSIASEFMHIPDSPERVWVQSQIEEGRTQALNASEKKRIFERLVAAEGLEKYLGAKYPGVKRYSLEGTDSIIIALDSLIQKGGALNIKEIVIGMAHRGRLNILVNVLGKSTSQLFDEFEGKHSESLESGDVKYHQGFSSDVETKGGLMHLSLAFNPSHLEVVSTVICGSVRAKQDVRQDAERHQVLSVAIHGDAAFAGQGVIMETLNMSKTRGFEIGGSVHIIVNNQIGFTTSNPHDARSTLYCSDIGKMLEIPIFHVNADDPEAVAWIVDIALQYRNKFKKDVIIDLVGYRRLGHNEADEPSVTQPVMYKIIRQHPTVVKLYGDRLIQEKILNSEEIKNIIDTYRDHLDQRHSAIVPNLVSNSKLDHSLGMPSKFVSNWEPYFNKDWRMVVNTGIPLELLKKLANKIFGIPPNFELHPLVKKVLDDRNKMTEGLMPADWGYGEMLAYASLLNEGFSVRLSGQDSGRGTFFHRHAVMYDQKTGKRIVPLQTMQASQGHFSVYDTLLSEEGVLGFEYGYASSDPNNLVIWEAQFGDFANTAQVIIDQFIASGEQKWKRLCGITLFLPHGYEGQGPEHSSARLERYLQLCAQHNMQVCIPTTPAQIFHVLRRQMIRPLRIPLILLTPKAFLRHKLAGSDLKEFTEGGFHPILGEEQALENKNVNRVILCSGKIYYLLLQERMAQQKRSVALIRIEQLYPFPEIELKKILEPYQHVKDIIWCQEEPQNQGAWYSSQHHIQACLNANQTLRYAGRPAAAASAVGYHHLHEEQQKKLLKEALD